MSATIIPFPAPARAPQPTTQELLARLDSVLHDPWYWADNDQARMSEALEIAESLARAAARTMRRPKGAA